MKKNNLELYLSSVLVLFIMSSFKIQAQNEENIKERYIPIVTYEPYNLNVSIVNAFSRLPNTDYLRITFQEGKYKYYINQGVETYLSALNYANGEVEVVGNHSSYSITPPFDIMKTDSVFILNLERAPRYSLLQGVYPIDLFGVISGNRIEYYQNKAENKESIGLDQAIKLKYSSINIFKEKLLTNMSNSLNMNPYNGIFQLDKKSVIMDLQKDFVYFWECFPDEEKKSIELFFNFLEENITLTSEQKRDLETKIQSTKEYRNIRDLTSRRYPKEYTKLTIEVIGRDFSDIIQDVLTDEQFEVIHSQYILLLEMRELYFRGPLICPYIKIDDTKPFTEIPVWNSLLSTIEMQKISGKYRAASYDEMKIYWKNTVFEKSSDVK